MKKFLVVLITMLSLLLMPSVEAKINLPEKTEQESTARAVATSNFSRNSGFLAASSARP